MRLRFIVALGCTMAGTAACGSDPDPCADQQPDTVCTWLGLKGAPGFGGDGKMRYETPVNQVQDLVFFPDGTAWYSDLNNHLVRRVAVDGHVDTVVGWTDPVFPGDGPLTGITAAGAPGAEWQLTHPTALLIRPDGVVLVAAWHNYKILEVDAEHRVTVFAGGDVGFAGDGGPREDARFARPNDLTFDEAGNLYVADQQNQRIRVIDPAGRITTFAGTGEEGPAGDGGAAIDAALTWADSSSPNPSGNLLVHDGTLFVADTEAHRIRAIDLATNVIDTFAGTGEAGFRDGPVTDALLRGPRDLEIGPDGDLYFADTDNGAVRAIDLDTATIRTVVGTGELGIDEDEGTAPLETPLRRPFGIAFDPVGDLYVMDSLNERIVRVRAAN